MPTTMTRRRALARSSGVDQAATSRAVHVKDFIQIAQTGISAIWHELIARRSLQIGGLLGWVLCSGRVLCSVLEQVQDSGGLFLQKIRDRPSCHWGNRFGHLGEHSIAHLRILPAQQGLPWDSLRIAAPASGRCTVRVSWFLEHNVPPSAAIDIVGPRTAEWRELGDLWFFWLVAVPARVSAFDAALQQTLDVVCSLLAVLGPGSITALIFGDGADVSHDSPMQDPSTRVWH